MTDAEQIAAIRERLDAFYAAPGHTDDPEYVMDDVEKIIGYRRAFFRDSK